MTNPSEANPSNAQPEYIAIIGTVVEKPENLQTPCGKPLGDLAVGRTVIIVPRDVFLDAVRDPKLIE